MRLGDQRNRARPGNRLGRWWRFPGSWRDGSTAGEIRKLLAPGRRKQTEAYSRLRPLAIVDSNIRGEDLEPSDATLRKLGRRLLTGESWEQVFPGAAAVRIETAGEGPSISFRLTKKEGVPVQLVPEGTPGAAVVAVRRVDELSFYNLGRKQLADRLGITAPKLTALVEVYGLRNDPDYFKLFRIGQSSFGRYSQLAMGRVEEILRETTLEDVWRRYQEQR